jgi:hypothetical protein
MHARVSEVLGGMRHARTTGISGGIANRASPTDVARCARSGNSARLVLRQCPCSGPVRPRDGDNAVVQANPVRIPGHGDGRAEQVVSRVPSVADAGFLASLDTALGSTSVGTVCARPRLRFGSDPWADSARRCWRPRLREPSSRRRLPIGWCLRGCAIAGQTFSRVTPCASR